MPFSFFKPDKKFYTVSFGIADPELAAEAERLVVKANRGIAKRLPDGANLMVHLGDSAHKALCVKLEALFLEPGIGPDDSAAVIELASIKSFGERFRT